MRQRGISISFIRCAKEVPRKTEVITPNKQLILLGSHHLPTVFLKTTLTRTITLDKQLILLGSNHLPTVSEDYSHPDDHTRQTTDTPGFKPFSK